MTVPSELETRPTPYAHVPPTPSSFRRALTQALLLSLLPLATAFAQSGPFVQVTRDGTDIRPTRRPTSGVIMTASRGTVLEVIHIDGNRYAHRDSNWYMVLLPRDSWGDRPSGWIRGDAVVEHVPPPRPAPATQASVVQAPQVPQVPQVQQARHEPSEMVVPEAARVETVRAAQPVSDVVLHFDFGKSQLTDEARDKLASAVATLKANPQGLLVAVEGHADSTGPEAYNERLGMARAETVRQYLAAQLQIPADKISVVSYGESNPSAPNTTQEGRARNRRVLIKVGA